MADLTEAIRESDERVAGRDAYLASPEGQAEREQSRTAYADLDAAGSKALLADKFETALDALDLDPARALDAGEIDRFFGDSVIRVDPGDEGGPKELEASSLPLRAPDGSEGKEPLDMSLDQTPDGYEPDNPLVDVSMPDDADDPVEVESIGLELAGAEGASARLLQGSDVFYPQVDEDTDALVAPLSSGVDYFLQLRSQSSPEDFAFNLRLPTGVSAQGEDGGAVISSSQGVLARIPAPAAIDAQGSDVPVEMSVVGDRLELHVAHQSADLAYPLLIDPEVNGLGCTSNGFGECFKWKQDGTGVGLGFWPARMYNGNQTLTEDNPYSLRTACRTNIGCAGAGDVPGLFAYARKGKTFHEGDLAHFHYKVPGWNDGVDPENGEEAFIQQIAVGPIYYKANSNKLDPHLVIGIHSAKKEGEGTPNDGLTARKVWDTNEFENKYWELTNCDDGCAGGTNGYRASHGVFLGYATAGPGSTTLPTDKERIGYFGGARVTIRDEGLPHDVSGTLQPATGWVDDQDYTIAGIGGVDEGLGMKTIRLFAPDGAFEQTTNGDVDVRVKSLSCVGLQGDPCPRVWPSAPDPSFDQLTTTRLPQGRNTMLIWAEDVLQNVGLKTLELLVDRSPPQIQTSGGLGYANRNGVAPDDNLDIAVTDGSQTPDSAQRSGVAHVEVEVNGEAIDTYDQPCPLPGNCRYPQSGTKHFEINPFDYATDDLHIKVTARDQVGTPSVRHESTLEWDVELASGHPKVERIVSCRAEDGACIDGEELLECPNGDRSCIEGRPSPPGWLGSDTPAETAVFGSDPGAEDVQGAGRDQRGVRTSRVFLPDGSHADTTINPDCATGGRLCPEYSGFTHEYSSGNPVLPEGVHDATARVKTPGGEVSDAKRFELRVDRTKPTIDQQHFQLSTLWQLRNALVQPGTYDLRIDATDPQGASQRSGVKSIEVTVDGDRAFFRSRSCDRVDWETGCPLDRTFHFDPADYESGQHEIAVYVTDGAGNVAEIPDGDNDPEPDQTFDIQVTSVPPPVEPDSDRFGLEQYFDYDSTETGLSSAHVNLATGNAVWHKVPIVEPGRGLSSVVNLTYNSYGGQGDALAPLRSHIVPTGYGEAGRGFSIGISGVTRVNEPLRGLLGPAPGYVPVIAPPEVTMTDPDGTAHVFTLDAGQAPGDLYSYTSGAGIHLHLRRFEDPELVQLNPEDHPKAWAMTRPDGVTYYYDGYGFLRSIEDRNGNVMRFEYDNVLLETGGLCGQTVIPLVCEPRLARVIDPAGTDPGADPGLVAKRTLTIDYYPTGIGALPQNGRISTITDHKGRELTFEYGYDGRLTKITEAANTTTARETNLDYDDPTLLSGEHRQLIEITDPVGNSTHVNYEPNQAVGDPGREVISVENRNENTRTYEYSTDAGFDFAEITDARGNAWQHMMDRDDRPVRMTDPLGTETDLGWDDDNNVIALTEGIDSSAPPGPDVATTHYEYNENGLLTAMHDPLGRTTLLSYEDGFGTQLSGVQDLVSGESIDCERTSLLGGSSKESFVSDLVAIHRPEGNTWTYDVEDQTTPDCEDGATSNGNVASQTDPDGNAATTEYYEPENDPGDDPRFRGMPELETDEVGNATHYEAYDANGLPSVVVDPRGTAGNPAQHRWLYRYDDAGNLEQAIDPRGGGDASVLNDPLDPNLPFASTLTYDPLDRLAAERIPKNSANGNYIDRTYDYDLNDNRTLITDGAGQDWVSTYTPMDRLGSEETPEHQTTKYGYDDEEGLTSIESPNGVDSGAAGDYLTDFRLDAAGRRVATIQRSTQDPDLVTSYAYDRRDNVTGIAYPKDNPSGDTPANVDQAVANASIADAQRFAYSYDKADELSTQVETPGSDADSLNLRTEYRYDLNGNLSRELHPNGFVDGHDPAAYTTQYDYDGRDLLVHEIDPLGNTRTIERRPDGLVVAEVSPRASETPGDPDDFKTVYSYDANGELISRSIPWRDGQYGLSDAELKAMKVSYVRNAVGDPTEITDAVGNLAAYRQTQGGPYAQQYGDLAATHTFQNSFLDTGDLKTTERPSFFQYSGQQPGDPAMARTAMSEGAISPLMASQPVIVERPDGGANVTRDAVQQLPTSQGVGDLGPVPPQEMPGILPKAGETSFDYDGEMRLAGVTDAVGKTTSLDYDPAGRLKNVDYPFKPSDPIHNHYEYDLNDNLTEMVDGEGEPTSYLPDEFDRIAEETRPGSPTPTETTVFDYDRNSNLIEQTSPRGSVSQFRYDPADRLTDEINPENETTCYGYDADGNRTSETTPRGCPTPGPNDYTRTVPSGYTTTTTYDPADRAVAVEDPEGDLTTMQLDAAGNVTRLTEPGSETGEGFMDRVTLQTYDGRDLPWQKTQFYLDDGDLKSRTTVSEYDANGNLRRTVNPRGVSSAPGLGPDSDPYSQPQPQFTDPGFPFTDSVKNDSPVKNAVKEATLYEYSSDDIRTEIYQPWGDEGATQAQQDNSRERYRQDFELNERGWVKGITAPYQWTTSSAPEATKYEQFDSGWISRATDPGGGLSGRQDIHYDYDERGLQTLWQSDNYDQQTSTDGRKVTREYYPSGLLQRRIGFKRETATTTEKRRHVYTYDRDRRLTDFLDCKPTCNGGSSDHATHIEYDQANRPLAVNEPGGEADTRYSYYKDGAVKHLRTDGSCETTSTCSENGYSGGKLTAYNYDEAGRELCMKVGSGADESDCNAQQDVRLTKTDYFPSSQPSRRTKSNETSEDYLYGPDGAVLEKKRTPGGGSPRTQAYAYDPNANRTKDERGTYAYNPRDQVITWTRAGDFSEHPGTTVRYTLDGAGQVLTEVDGGPSPALTTTFHYSGDQLERTSFTGGAQDQLYHYDPFGNLDKVWEEGSQSNPLATYTYDEFSRRTDSDVREGSDHKIESYDYDGLDRRTTITKESQTRQLSYVGLTEELSSERRDVQGGPDETRSYDYDSRGVRQGQQTSGADQGNGYRTYDLDPSGSVLGLEDGSGQIDSGSRYDYDPYGELENEDDVDDPAAKANPFRFQGFYYDSAIRMYDMEARTYAPAEGRFTGQDRYEASGADLTLQSDPLTQNRYVFAGGNPVTQIEWDGHKPIDCVFCTATGGPRRAPANATTAASPSTGTYYVQVSQPGGYVFTQSARPPEAVRVAAAKVSRDVVERSCGHGEYCTQHQEQVNRQRLRGRLIYGGDLDDLDFETRENLTSTTPPWWDPADLVIGGVAGLGAGATVNAVREAAAGLAGGIAGAGSEGFGGATTAALKRLAQEESGGGFAASAAPRAAGEFEIAPRVAGQLKDARLGPLAGKLGPDDVRQLANSPSASRYLDATTGNINVIQQVEGRTLRITTPRDAMRIISVGPIREQQVANGIASGRFIQLH